jgi:ComF family protein
MQSRLVAELVALAAPPACVVCRGRLGRADLWLCGECVRALPWLPARRCPRCGLPTHRRRSCPAAGQAFTRAWAPLAHEGVAREIVAALKFRRALPVADLMAAHMAANVPAELRDSGVIVPVPPHRLRRRRRGFDPAGLLSEALAERLAVEERACLRRRDRASRQVGATRAQRRRAGRLTIELRAPPPRRALLVDDVHTTGTTLDACARALLAGGCHEVVALTYTRTL